MKCVRRFCGHVNRVLPVGAAFSPCLRFLAVGSEDKARAAVAPNLLAPCVVTRVFSLSLARACAQRSHVYDIGTGLRVSIAACGADAAVDVAWDPTSPTLAVAGSDGVVSFYV